MKLFQLLILTLVFTCSGFAQASHNSWLQGVWEGRGVQNDGVTWSMKLSVDNNKYLIAYPSLKCAGYWNLSSIDANSARFIERIANSGVCLDKLIVSLERISDRQLNVKFSSVVDTFAATAILHRIDVTQRLSVKQKTLDPPGNPGKAQKTSLEDRLIGYEKQTWVLAERKELDKFAAFIAEDFTGIYPDAENVTKSQLMQSLGAIVIKSYELTNFKVVRLNKNAWLVNYKATSIIEEDGQEKSARVASTAGWAKRGNKWLMVFYQEMFAK